MKEFNTLGVCNPDIHYMADMTEKLNRIAKMVEKGLYFVINRPRQYGKTTTLASLEKLLINKDYLVISLSFGGIGDLIFEKEDVFSAGFIDLMAKNIEPQDQKLSEFLVLKGNVKNLNELSEVITEFCKKSARKVGLMIDEVDKSSNNQLFISFLGMLREKYLLRARGKDYTFHSVILAGVHDIKTLKLKIRPDEQRKYNSPWNIAANFDVDLSLSPAEIGTMLQEYSAERKIMMDIAEIAAKLFYYTSGYPFLVSRLCEITDAEIMKENKWETGDLEQAVRLILKESNTNFDDLIKNLENNGELYELVNRIVLDGELINYNPHNPVINLGTLYGVFIARDEKVAIHNRIYEQILYNYMTSKLEVKPGILEYNFQDNFIQGDRLDMEKVLLKFQQFMNEKYSNRDERFLEREGTLLFLAFLKPIINGRGFDFKEPQISEERRIDVAVTFMKNKYIVELKIWRGKAAHGKGILQLKDYLDKEGLDKGYLVVYDFRKEKDEWQQDRVMVDGKEIFAVRV